jgi:hypothetical protein
MADVNLPTQYPAIPEPTLDPAAMLRTLQLMKEAVELLCGTRSKNYASLGQGVFEMRARAENLAATLRQVDEVSTANGEALAQRTLTLEASFSSMTGQLSDTNARLTDVSTARANGDSALAQRATTLEAALSDTSRQLNARLGQVDQARADGDGALAARTLNLEAQFGEYGLVSRLNAYVTQSTQAQADKNNALAQAITNVQASADGISASGAVELTANAGVGGTQASYSWNLKAHGKASGMYATIDGNGVGNIMFVADQFRFFDPNRGPVPVLAYVAGKFTFTSDVRIAGNLVVDGSINTDQIGNGAVSQLGAGSSSGQTMSFGMRTFGGRLIFLVTFNGAPGIRGPLVASIGSVDVQIDGILIASMIPSFDAYQSGYSLMPTSYQFPRFDIGPGDHTFTATANNPWGIGGISLIVMELRR